MKKNIDSHIPYVTGKEIYYLKKVLKKKKFSGRGFFSKECENIISNNYKKREVLLTSSCTDALEMAAILLNIKAGDEVILPSYTFVSTAKALVLRGAKLICEDTHNSHPCIDASQIEKKITKKTVFVIEASSYQLDYSKVFTSKYAIIFFTFTVDIKAYLWLIINLLLMIYLVIKNKIISLSQS